MAITRAQIAKQLLAKGGRIGLANGSRMDSGEAREARGEKSDFGGKGDNTRTRIQDERQRDFQQQQLRELTRNIDFDQGDTSLDIKRQPRGLNNLALSIFGRPFDIPLGALTRVINFNPPSTYTDMSNPNIGFGGRDEGINNMLYRQMMAQGPRTMDNVPTEEEEETPFRLAPRFRAEGGSMNDKIVGGEMDFESARQMYGLGKLVKKVTRSVKKIAKSPVGKAAIAAALFRMGGGLKETGFLKSKALPFLVGTGGTPRPPTKGILGVGGRFDPFKTILATSGIAGLMAGQEEEDETVSPEQLGPRLNIPQYRRDPFGNLAIRYRAEGGSTEQKEPVAKKTMPLLNMGGMEKDYREDGGFVPIGRMEKADDVPARLSKNEFVFTADAVRNAGEGDVDKGAEVMYNMMKNLEAGGEVSEESQGLEGARRMFQTSQRLEEVL